MYLLVHTKLEEEGKEGGEKMEKNQKSGGSGGYFSNGRRSFRLGYGNDRFE